MKRSWKKLLQITPTRRTNRQYRRTRPTTGRCRPRLPAVSARCRGAGGARLERRAGAPSLRPGIRNRSAAPARGPSSASSRRTDQGRSSCGIAEIEITDRIINVFQNDRHQREEKPRNDQAKLPAKSIWHRRLLSLARNHDRRSLRLLQRLRRGVRRFHDDSLMFPEPAFELGKKRQRVISQYLPP